MVHIRYIIVILILIAIIFLQRECSRHKVIDNSTHTTDTITFRDTIYKPKPYEVIKYIKKNITHHIIDTAYIPIIPDTNAILKDYFAKVVYKDTIINDTNAIITIYDTISQNRILSRSIQKRFFRHQITKPIKVRNKVFIGLGVNGWTDKFGATAQLGLLTKRDNLYTIGYDPINKSANVNIYWKIKLRK